MKKYYNALKQSLSEELARSAEVYLETGLHLFYKNQQHSAMQPIIGNIAIAIELILKSIIVKKNPILLFNNNLPQELKVAFSAPDEISKDFKWRLFDISLRSFEYTTIQLDEAISIFYTCFPKQKQALQPYFKFLSGIRNKSVHASVPSFQKYDLERIVYLSLCLVDHIRNSKEAQWEYYDLSENDIEFLKTFDEERTKRVKEKIEKAKEQSKKLKEVSQKSIDCGCNHYTTICPICNSIGMLSGYSEDDSEDAGDGGYTISLTFFAEGFECRECGIILSDLKEIELAGMDTTYDRTDDLDVWLSEQEADAQNGYQDYPYC